VGYIYIVQRVNVDQMGGFRLKLAIVCGGMLQIHLPVMAAPKSFCSVYPKMHCVSLDLFQYYYDCRLGNKQPTISIHSLMAHLACTVITLAETSFDFTSLNGCWFTERVRNSYATTGENWASIDHETEERIGVIETFCRSRACVCVCVP